MDNTQAKNNEIKRRLLLLLENNEYLVDEYIQKNGFTIDIDAIKAIRQQQTNGNDKALSSPVYEIHLTCPCCHTKGIAHRELHASAMAVRNDPFMAPVYFPLEKYEPLNYLTLSVAVCPHCYFASPDKKDFIQYNKTRKTNIPSQLSPGVIAELQEETPKRQKLVNESSFKTSFQKKRRSMNQAILSYTLANMRAEIETENKTPFSTVKQGGYFTRIALLKRQNGEEYEEALKEALKHYKKAYFLSDFPSHNIEFQSCFIIFSIHLRFGELKEAREFVAVMDQSKKELEENNERSALSSLNSWLDQAKTRWEDRDEDNLWDLPTS